MNNNSDGIYSSVVVEEKLETLLKYKHLHLYFTKVLHRLYDPLFPRTTLFGCYCLKGKVSFKLCKWVKTKRWHKNLQVCLFKENPQKILLMQRYWILNVRHFQWRKKGIDFFISNIYILYIIYLFLRIYIYIVVLVSKTSS